MSVPLTPPDAVSRNLSNSATHVSTLHALLQTCASGHDITPAAERIIRHCILSSSLTPQTLSLALDLLISSPNHAFWVDILSVIVENLKRRSTASCLEVIRKIPQLPHTALQHLAACAPGEVIKVLNEDKSPAIRTAAVHAVAAFVLRERPLTAPATDAIRLEKLSEEQIGFVRRACERLLYALVQSLYDPADSVAASTLKVLTEYCLEPPAKNERSVLSATKRATAASIWHLLIRSHRKLGQRFTQVTSNPKGTVGEMRERKEAIRGMARLAAHVLCETNIASQVSDTLREAGAWCVAWVDETIVALVPNANAELAACACSSLLVVCSYAVQEPTLEKVAQWGIKAVRRFTALLQEGEAAMHPVVMTNLVRDATNGLAALSKNEFVNSKFIVFTSTGLLPFAAKCAARSTRLQALCVVASTAVEYDLSGRDVGVGVSLKAILTSQSWKEIMAAANTDSNVAAETVCSFAQSLLDASRKIFVCPDKELRLNLTHTWAVMLSQLMNSTSICLSWPYSSAAPNARELYLKMFDALGQYSSYLLRTQGVGMEEYERVQESLVRAILDQKDVATRASLLVCITKYWLTSGMKAESNAGHLLKSIWKHVQEHYHDEEIFLKELRTGALWSEAKQGDKTPGEKAVEGGYVSFATSLEKRTRAVLGTVSTSVTNLIENTLFESIALATSAAEGSTLTTDYVYSSLSALLALVSQNPPMAERGITLLKRYIKIMDQAESSDFIALEAVRNTISALEMFQDEFFPKAVLPRTVIRRKVQVEDPLAWLKEITQSCVFATSRLDDPTKEASTVATEEAILHVAAATQKKMQAFRPDTLHVSDPGTRDGIEGDQQTLSGASDPFGVVASHSMDTVKGLALIRVDITNRSKFRATNATLAYSAAGALIPLPDASTSYPLGTIASTMSVIQRITVAVRSGQGYAGKLFFSIHVCDEKLASNTEEQTCVPYYIPSSDVLLLRAPALNSGVDVFRRRWDLMRHSLSFHVKIGKHQTVDEFVDTLERRSKCLREVGRMRTYSHVSALVADSSRGDYVAVACLAPEARGHVGVGACVVYVTIRSNSGEYNVAFRDECREWLRVRFRIVFPDEDLNVEDRQIALQPQDAYFITEASENLSPYQRWRAAHAVRVTL